MASLGTAGLLYARHHEAAERSIAQEMPGVAACAACHASGDAGVLYVALDTSAAQLRAAAFTRNLLLLFGTTLLLTTGLMVLIVRRFVSAPLRRLERFAGQLAGGDLSARPPEEQWPETRELSRTLRLMADRLQTSHDELERQVEDRSRRLVQAERLASLGQMSAQVAHGLRNPLNAIFGAAQYLRRVLGREPVMVEYGALIEDEVERVNGFVDDLLRVAHPAEPVFAPADPSEVAAEALRRAVLARGLPPDAVESALAPALPPLELDRKMMVEALVNLLDNALEAGGETAPRLVTRLDDAQGEAPAVLVEVLDRGGGIAPEVQDRLARPFVTTKPAGTGLGLVIVSHVAESHGGSFRLVDREGGGAQAVLRLPLARSLAPKVAA